MIWISLSFGEASDCGDLLDEEIDGNLIFDRSGALHEEEMLSLAQTCGGESALDRRCHDHDGEKDHEQKEGERLDEIGDQLLQIGS